MSTRATVEFRDERNKTYAYTHYDGHPDEVIPDIKMMLRQFKGENEADDHNAMEVATTFIKRDYPNRDRYMHYRVSNGWAGDESHRYFVRWNAEGKLWECGEIKDGKEEMADTEYLSTYKVLGSVDLSSKASVSVDAPSFEKACAIAKQMWEDKTRDGFEIWDGDFPRRASEATFEPDEDGDDEDDDQ
jgi:hypothetical protein